MRLFRKSAPIGRRPRQQDSTDRPAASHSYYSRRSEEDFNTGRKQVRAKRRPLPGTLRRFWLQRFGLVFLLVAVMASAVDVMSLSAHSSIQTVGSTAVALLHTQTEYQAAADKLFAATIWNRNKLTVNSGGIARQLKAEFPELASVSISVPILAHRPIVYIEPDQPAVLLIVNNGTFVLDRAGRTILTVTNPTSLADLNLPLVKDQSGLTLKRDQQGLTTSNVSFIQTIMAQLAAKSISVSSLTLPAGTSELDAAIGGHGYIVKFNLANNTARQQAGTFLATKARLESQQITPSQYIDVRVDGRAYYK